MKKIVAFIAMLVAGISVFAQEKGDMFISFSLDANLGFNTQTLSQGNLSEKIPTAFNPSGGVQAEYGYFPINNLKVALALGYNISANRSVIDNTKITTDMTNLVTINPNVAYYVKLADKFYYAPEFGFVYGGGTYSEAVTVSMKQKFPINSYSLYIQPITFEARVSEKWALGAGFGSLEYMCQSSKDKESGLKSNVHSFGLTLTSFAWGRFYF